MNKLDLGAVTAYAMAVEQGYEGTEEEFAALMANSGNNALRAENAADRAQQVLDSIPLDFQEVSQGVATLTEEIADVKTVGNTSIVRTKRKPNNMICKYEIEHGFYVDTMGVKQTSDDWNVTKAIDVSGLREIWLGGGVGLSCFYDDGMNFVSYFSIDNSEQYRAKVDVPAGAKYLICSILNAFVDTCGVYRAETDEYDDGLVYIENLLKKGYGPGFIKFKVVVNQTDVTKIYATDNQQIDNENVMMYSDSVLSLPESYSPYGKPSKLLMLCHGAGRGVCEAEGLLSWTQQEDYIALTKAFTDAGYAVFDTTGMNNTELGYCFWGNSRGVEAYRKAYQYVVDNYNVEHEFCVYGFSMGGLTALNLALSNFPNIKAIGLGSPVVKMESCWNDLGVRSVLKQLYIIGDDVTEYDYTRFIGSDPFQRVHLIGNKYLCLANLPPIKVWFGSTETGVGTDTGGGGTVTLAVNKLDAAQFANSILDNGGFAKYREVDGCGHEICYGNNPAITNEYVIWFNRFN